jgi:hypothetical protein
LALLQAVSEAGVSALATPGELDEAGDRDAVRIDASAAASAVTASARGLRQPSGSSTQKPAATTISAAAAISGPTVMPPRRSR